MIPEKEYITAVAKSLSRQEWLRSSAVGLQKKQDCSSIVTKGQAACMEPVDLWWWELAEILMCLYSQWNNRQAHQVKVKGTGIKS